MLGGAAAGFAGVFFGRVLPIARSSSGRSHVLVSLLPTMIELVQREPSASDALFLERLDAFMDKSIADIKAFAERESRPFEEVAAVSRCTRFIAS